MPGKPKSKRRSGCPVSITLEMFGDRWSLLIIHDLMVRGLRTFGEFQDSDEGIATNILADRLQKLQAAGIITAGHENQTGRQISIHEGEPINAPALSAIFREIIDHNRAGGWRNLQAAR